MSGIQLTLLENAMAGERSKARVAPRIERPLPGRYYPQIWRDLDQQIQRSDPQQQRVYEWQRGMIGRSRHLIDGACTQASMRREAVAYLEHLWSAYRGSFAPYFAGLPYLRLASLNRAESLAPSRRLSGHASIYRHTIHLNTSGFYRETIVHEVCHLLAWRDCHGPQFCRALVHLWAGEFAIAPKAALDAAERRGIEVDLRPIT